MQQVQEDPDGHLVRNVGAITLQEDEIPDHQQINVSFPGHGPCKVCKFCFSLQTNGLERVRLSRGTSIKTPMSIYRK